MPEAKLKIVKSLTFSILVIIIFFGGLEFSLRIKGFRYERRLSYLEFGYPNRKELHQVFELDQKLIFRMKPGYDFGLGFKPLNQQGFYGDDFKQEKPEGVLRIACLGDSVTFGRPEGNYPEILKEILNQAGLGKEFQVYNFGVPGYSSWQGKNLLGMVLKEYKPDWVIISYVWNDHWRARGFSDSEQVLRSEPTLVKFRDLISYLRIYQLVNWSMVKLGVSAGEEKFRVPINEYRENLKEMVEMGKNGGAKIIFATAPSGIGLAQLPDYFEHLGFLKKGDSLPELHNQYNQVLLKVAKEQGVEILDLDLLFQKNGVKNFFDHPDKDIIHPNRKGLELMAEAISEIVIQELKEDLKKEGKK